VLVLQAKDKGGLLYCKPPVFNVVLAIDAVCRTFMVPAKRIHASTSAEMRSALELSTALRQRWAEALYAVGVSDEVHGEGTTELLYTLICERWLHMRQRQMRLLYVQGKLAAAERQADALRTARKGDRGGRDKDGQMGKSLVKLIMSLAPAAAHTALQGVLAAEPPRWRAAPGRRCRVSEPHMPLIWRTASTCQQTASLLSLWGTAAVGHRIVGCESAPPKLTKSMLKLLK